jgi:hypothetical protein
MKKVNTYICCLVLAGGITSCAGVSDANEPPATFKETRTVKKFAAKGMEWTAQYLPTEFHVMRAERSNPGLTDVQKDSVGNEYYPFYYFRTTVSGDRSKETKETGTYMNYTMQHDFFMVIGNDSVPAFFSQAIATGDPGNHEFMLAFPRIDTIAALPIKIVFNDRVFGTGRTECVFNSNDLKD